MTRHAQKASARPACLLLRRVRRHLAGVLAVAVPAVLVLPLLLVVQVLPPPPPPQLLLLLLLRKVAVQRLLQLLRRCHRHLRRLVRLHLPLAPFSARGSAEAIASCWGRRCRPRRTSAAAAPRWAARSAAG